MDSFRTTLAAQQAPFQIGHQDRLMLLGSCFTEHIGNRLLERKFHTSINPFGIVYNPISISRCLSRLVAGNELFSAADLFENMGLWHSWEHHGHFSKPDREEALTGINKVYEQAATTLQQSNRLLLTLGTADVFWLAPDYSLEKIVANNHKMPAAFFQQKQLSVGEVTDALAGILSKLTAKKPDLQIILSVSPVRHLRNGMIENQRSKAVLLLACADICQQISNAHYFPAYELLLDDLRDYRFYAADMIHPSEVAVDYIWQYFANMFFSPETRQLNQALEKISAAARHRPFNPDTPQHQSFVAAQLDAIQRLKADWPQMDFSPEETLLRG